jgi:UPF0755 protein
MVRASRIIIPLLVILLALIAGAAGIRYALLLPVENDRIFDIPAGDNLSSLTGRLAGQEVLRVDEALFKVVALASRGNGPILAGQYRIKAGMDSLELLSLFRSGKVIQHRITFPEGWTLDQWLAVLWEAPYLESALPTLEHESFAGLFDIEGEPEGWFFPDTYYYVKGDTELDVLAQAHKRMKEVLRQEWNARGSVGKLTSEYDALILASIIEKETGSDADREKIASVFHNRLTLGMKLQSDPTVIYGMGQSFTGDLKRQHLRTDTPFNTYTRTGLIPTPICSPGRASIRAALAGSMHPYLYFVAKGNGESQFSITLNEHNKAVDEYQRKRTIKQ